MVTKQKFFFPSSDGVHQLHACLWQPEGAPRGVLQLVHGISEHIGRYDHFASFLAQHGFAVAAHDHLGHGGSASSGEYGFFGDRDGWKHVVSDVYALRRQMGERFPGIPYFILGHSMGSFVTRTYLIDYPGTISGVLLSGTGQESAPLVAAGKAVASLCCALRGGNSRSRLVTELSTGAYNRQFAPNRTGSDWISRDAAVVDAYTADPLCRFVPTVGMFRDMMGGLQYIGNPRNLARMDRDTPVYFFSGDKDPVGGSGKGVRKVYQLFQAAGVKDVSLKLYPEGRHEMLNELNRDQVYDDVLSWLSVHL